MEPWTPLAALVFAVQVAWAVWLMRLSGCLDAAHKKLIKDIERPTPALGGGEVRMYDVFWDVRSSSVSPDGGEIEMEFLRDAQSEAMWEDCVKERVTGIVVEQCVLRVMDQVRRAETVRLRCEPMKEPVVFGVPVSGGAPSRLVNAQAAGDVKPHLVRAHLLGL